MGFGREMHAIRHDEGRLALACDLRPEETIQVKDGRVVKRILEIAGEKGAQTIVVGMPRNMDGSFGPAAQKARDFIEALKLETSCTALVIASSLTVPVPNVSTATDTGSGYPMA